MLRETGCGGAQRLAEGLITTAGGKIVCFLACWRSVLGALLGISDTIAFGLVWRMFGACVSHYMIRRGAVQGCSDAIGCDKVPVGFFLGSGRSRCQKRWYIAPKIAFNHRPLGITSSISKSCQKDRYYDTRHHGVASETEARHGSLHSNNDFCLVMVASRGRSDNERSTSWLSRALTLAINIPYDDLLAS